MKATELMIGDGVKRSSLNKLPVEDLREIAHWHKIIKNYLKMDRLLKENGTQNKRTSSEA